MMEIFLLIRSKMKSCRSNTSLLKKQSKVQKNYDSWQLGIQSSGDVLGFVEDDILILNLEPLHGILLDNPVLDSRTRFAPAATANTVARTFQYDTEVHTVDTSGKDHT